MRHACIVECRYCQTSVYLPDELWRRFHPVKIVREWSLLYQGTLISARALREQAEEEARERASQARAAAAA